MLAWRRARKQVRMLYVGRLHNGTQDQSLRADDHRAFAEYVRTEYVCV